MRLLHPPSLIRARRRRWRHHQAQTLQQHYRPLRRCPPNELATLALAVLDVNVASGILQAAILEGAIDEDPVVKNQVLVFEDFVFVSSHEKLRLPLPRSGGKFLLRWRRLYPSGAGAGVIRPPWDKPDPTTPHRLTPTDSG